MFKEIIEEVMAEHGDFGYEELEEICQDFYDTIPKKIKQETKLRRVRKYMNGEFEIEESQSYETSAGSGKYKEYSLETLPKYLFEGKTKIASGLINIIDLSLHISGEALFMDSNMKVNKTDKVALIGKNGAGKTTLLKVILDRAGVIEKDKTKFLDIENMDGQIEMAAGMKIGYLSQDLFWSDTNNTLREEILTIFPEIDEKIQRLEVIKNDPDMWEETAKLNKELKDLNGFKKHTLMLEIHRYFGITDEHLDYNVLKLSGGEQTKIQIAKFLISEVDILILDEPTNHLDIDGIIFLENFCQVWKKAIISISHDVRFINNTCHRIAEISGKQIHDYKGNYDYYVEEKKERYDKQMRDHDNQQKYIEAQEAFINRFRANSAKAALVQSRIKALDKLERIEKPEDEIFGRFIHVESNMRLPEVIMKLKNIEVGYQFPLVTLPEYIEVRKSDKIGIIGKNGSGKTTLLKTILGQIPALDGESEINERVKIGGYAQVLEWLDASLSIIKELSKDYDNQQDIRKMLGGLLITGDKVDQEISTLSWGERAKVALAKMLLSSPDIIIMDEPTNHLDIHSKQVIKHMLQSFEGTTLIVSHDRDLLESVSNKLWLIKGMVLATYDEPEKGFSEIF